MWTHQLGKVMVGLVALALVIGPASAPVSADTRGATVTGGSLDVYEPYSPFLLDSFAIGTTCGSDPGSNLTFAGSSGSGHWSASTSSDVSQVFGVTDVRVRLDIDIAGTYSGSSLSGTADVTATVQTDDYSPCVNLDNEVCTLLARNISVSGSHTVSSPPTIQTGATVSVSGDNGPSGMGYYDTEVLGHILDCDGWLLSAGDGLLEINGLVLTI